MKRFLTLVLLFSAMVFAYTGTSASVSAAPIKADIQSIRIPEGTYLKLELIDPVSTKLASVGDEFNAMLSKDLLVKSTIALPAGTIFRGTVNKIIPSKRLSRSAILYINIDHVVTPTGRQIPVVAGFYNMSAITIDGGIYEGGNYGWALKQNWANTKNIMKTTTDWGKGTGENMQYVCTPIGALGGVIGGGAYLIGDSIADLFRKGNQVNMPQGKVLDVMLTQPIDIPIH